MLDQNLLLILGRFKLPFHPELMCLLFRILNADNDETTENLPEECKGGDEGNDGIPVNDDTLQPNRCCLLVPKVV